MLIRNLIFWLSTKRGVTDRIARHGMKNGFARRFVAGESLAEALAASQELCSHGRNVSLNHLGENVTSEAAAREVCASYIQMVEELHAKNLNGNISIKLTQLGLDIDKELCRSMAREIAARAAALGRAIEMDMEGSVYTDVTLDIFESVQRELGNCGLAVQAYLYRTEKDLHRLAPVKPKIRLVKGAYREPKDIALQKKSEVDASYQKLTTLLLEGAAKGTFLPAIASHDWNMVAHAQAEAARLKLDKSRYEFQMTPCELLVCFAQPACRIGQRIPPACNLAVCTKPRGWLAPCTIPSSRNRSCDSWHGSPLHRPPSSPDGSPLEPGPLL